MRVFENIQKKNTGSGALPVFFFGCFSCCQPPAMRWHLLTAPIFFVVLIVLMVSYGELTFDHDYTSQNGTERKKLPGLGCFRKGLYS